MRKTVLFVFLSDQETVILLVRVLHRETTWKFGSPCLLPRDLTS